MVVVVDGGLRTDMDCLACAMVNWYLVTCEVVAADAVVPSMEVEILAKDATKVVADEVRNLGEVHALTGILEPVMNWTPLTTDVTPTLVQDSQYPDVRNIQMGAFLDGQIGVMRCFRALEVANCCCCCCYLDCPGSE